MCNFSVLILTYNEESNIEKCINSILLSNDIVVLDSFSNDKTKEIVKSFNVRFYERKFTNYSEQRNYGLHNITYREKLVLILDADEIVTNELFKEITQISKKHENKILDVYFVRRRVLFEDKILKWNYTSNVWIERLVKPNQVFFIGSVHEKIIYKGSNGLLKNYIIHNQFSKGLKDWISRRKKYAILENRNQDDLKKWSSQVNNMIRIRVSIKIFFIKNIPFAYVFYFLYNFFIKFAFLDGYKGLKYIILETYSYYLTSKYKEKC